MFSGGKNHYVSGRSSTHRGYGERHNFERVDRNMIEGKKMFKKFEIIARTSANMSKCRMVYGNLGTSQFEFIPIYLNSFIFPITQEKLTCN